MTETQSSKGQQDQKHDMSILGLTTVCYIVCWLIDLAAITTIWYIINRIYVTQTKPKNLFDNRVVMY